MYLNHSRNQINLLAEIIAGEHKPGLISRRTDSWGTGGEVFKADRCNMHHVSAKEIGFQPQAEGSASGVTPLSTRVRAKAALTTQFDIVH